MVQRSKPFSFLVLHQSTFRNLFKTSSFFQFSGDSTPRLSSFQSHCVLPMIYTPPPPQQIPVASSHSSSNDKKTRMKWQTFGGLAHPAALFAGVGLLRCSIHHPALLGRAGLLSWITWSSALFARVGGVGEGGCGLLVDGIAALENTHTHTNQPVTNGCQHSYFVVKLTGGGSPKHQCSVPYLRNVIMFILIWAISIYILLIH